MLTQELRKRLRQFCESYGCFMNGMICQAVYEFLEQHENDSRWEFIEYMVTHGYKHNVYISPEEQEWLDRLNKQLETGA